jgi:hypothetical protein
MKKAYCKFWRESHWHVQNELFVYSSVKESEVGFDSDGLKVLLITLPINNHWKVIVNILVSSVPNQNVVLSSKNR